MERLTSADQLGAEASAVGLQSCASVQGGEDDDWSPTLLLDDEPLGEFVDAAILGDACTAAVDGEPVEECGASGIPEAGPVCVRWQQREDRMWEAVFQWRVAPWGQACIDVSCETRL